MIETIVKVDGMMCGMCESHINDAIRRHFQVRKVSSSHSKGSCARSSTPPATRPWTWCPVPWKSAACWAA